MVSKLIVYIIVILIDLKQFSWKCCDLGTTQTFSEIPAGLKDKIDL